MHRTANPFAYPKPITLDSLEDLFAHHRDRFGGFRMEDDDAAKAAAQAAADAKAAADKAAAKFEPITSQEDLDRRLGERLARERAKFADYDDMKAKAEAHDKAVEDAKTEAQKAVDAAKAEGEAAGRAAGNERIVKAEAKVVAAEMKFRNPALAIATIDLKGVKVGDDGEVDAAAIKAKLTELAASDPYLVDDGKKPAPKADKSQGGGGGNDDGPSLARGRDIWEERHGRKKASA